MWMTRDVHSNLNDLIEFSVQTFARCRSTFFSIRVSLNEVLWVSMRSSAEQRGISEAKTNMVAVRQSNLRIRETFIEEREIRRRLFSSVSSRIVFSRFAQENIFIAFSREAKAWKLLAFCNSSSTKCWRCSQLTFAREQRSPWKSTVKPFLCSPSTNKLSCNVCENDCRETRSISAELSFTRQTERRPKISTDFSRGSDESLLDFLLIWATSLRRGKDRNLFVATEKHSTKLKIVVLFRFWRNFSWTRSPSALLFHQSNCIV